MQQTCAVFGNLEGSGIGLNFSNATENINNYSYVSGLFMFIVSFVVFALLGSYFDKILPKQYGEKQSCCFCCSKKFCCCCCSQDREVFEEQLDAGELQRRDTLRSSNSRNAVDDPFELKYL